MKNQHITSAALFLIKKNHKYLLTKRVELDDESKDRVYHEHWQIPGGGQRFSETLHEAVHREAKEELRLNIKIICFVPKIYDAVRKNWHGLLHIFLCEMVNKNQKIILNHEASTYAWFTVEEVKNLPTFPETYDIILQAEKIS